MELSDIKKVSFGGYDRQNVEDYIEALHTKYNTLYQNANSQIEFFTEKTNNLEKELESTKKQNSDLSVQNEKLQGIIEQEYKKIQEINLKSSRLLDENNKFKQLNITISEFESLRKRNEELTLAVEELKRRGTDVNQAELQQLRHENRNYSAIIDDLRTKVIDTSQEDVDKLRSENQSYILQIEQLKRQLEAPSADMQMIDEVKTKVTNFLQKAKQKESEILSDANKTAEMIISNAHDQSRKLKNQINEESENMLVDTRKKIDKMSKEALEQSSLNIKITKDECEGLIQTTQAQVSVIIQTAKQKAESIVEILKTRNHTLQLEKEALMRQSEDVVRKATISGQNVGMSLNDIAVKKQKDTAEYFDEIAALKNSINLSLNELKASLDVMDTFETDF